ncbi:hypothetical protein Desku_1228 [Desulfofundulus kuznetsovii DSM 6115]|uniref:Uncharacterized protein n=1 Tax=Desulfofundulus kuznetsovii (strain DSM 6115 / VKM B-1805 / 17) TaxID=760568 RepID=A0AAU8PC77_DESK7|nr:hypothetical protein Desku_1228 [Desulfofundulus kuznetsovii DSM 6115]
MSSCGLVMFTYVNTCLRPGGESLFRPSRYFKRHAMSMAKARFIPHCSGEKVYRLLELLPLRVKLEFSKKSGMVLARETGCVL